MLEKGWFWGIAIVPVVLAVLIFARGLRWIGTAGLISIAALLPVLGFVPFLYQTFSTVADHYMYLAMLGPALALAWGLSRVPAQRARGAAIACSIVFVALAMLTAVQLRHWRDSKAVLDRILAVRPRSILGHCSLGNWYERQRDYDAAEKEYKRAVAIDPKYPIPRGNLASVYAYLGRADEAVAEIHELIELHGKYPLDFRQDYSMAFFEIGRLTVTRGMYADAAKYFREDLRYHPDHAEAKEALRKAEAQMRESASRPATTRTSQ